ncbi:hypothetical protein ACFFJT_04600 [Dyella flava]|uniref:Uncharacterized protein n=1 Tax=Dyella flava TaxID=1920170 RepID=A0ABS2K6E8_9GAMM|nr:hypothetical protein [Dyella flava]MBM7126635.1 hypothetical protein [Dyella flava]
MAPDGGGPDAACRHPAAVNGLAAMQQRPIERCGYGVLWRGAADPSFCFMSILSRADRHRVEGASMTVRRERAWLSTSKKDGFEQGVIRNELRARFVINYAAVSRGWPWMSCARAQDMKSGWIALPHWRRQALHVAMH